MAQCISSTLKHLDKAVFTPWRTGWTHDYGFTPDSGMLNTFEYLRSLVTFERLQEILPMKIFVSGPHTKEALILTDPYTFGHYNPDFVKYFLQGVKTLAQNKSLIQTTKANMTQYGLIEKMKRFYIGYIYIEKNHDEFIQYKTRFEKKLEDQTWEENEYRNIPKGLLYPNHYNWSESVYYFWVRREIDGTKELWIEVIKKGLVAYGVELENMR